MSSYIQSIYFGAFFRLQNLSALQILDLLLVTFAFFVILSVLRKSQSALLMRGALALGLLLFVVGVLLPLPAFEWLVTMALIALFITMPIIFQPEVRNLLARLGRNTALGRAVRHTAVEKFAPPLLRAVENMSETRTGALIVLEGDDQLHHIIETGVPVDGEVTSELLQSVFFPDSPLHDGAVIIREQKIVAAGCVLPLTEGPLKFNRRLGTRHRAAVGLSEQSDALVVVVSEETGGISLAQEAVLQYTVDGARLRQDLFDFYQNGDAQEQKESFWQSVQKMAQAAKQKLFSMTRSELLAYFTLLIVSFLLAVVVWSFVAERNDPAKRALIEGIPLRIENIPPDTALVSQPPDTVSAIIQTTASVLNTLSAGGFQAVVSLANLEPGLHLVEVDVDSGAEQVLISSVDPAAINVELAPIISRTMEVAVELSNLDELSPAYEISEPPSTTPESVLISGPAPLVEQVEQLQTTVSVANLSASKQELRPVKALDEAGRNIKNINLNPEQVLVNVAIQQLFNARDVGVHALTTGTVTSDYWLNGLSVTPGSVTLIGSPGQLDGVGSFVNTLPVDISRATGDLTVQTPLDLPIEVRALDGDGNTLNTVTVFAEITPRVGDLSVSRPVEIIGASPEITVTVNPLEVDLLLSGDVPVLREILAQPELLRILLYVSAFESGQDFDVIPLVILPDGVNYQMVPPSVQVTIEP